MQTNPQIAGSVKQGTLQVTWKDEGKAFEYTRDRKVYRYDLATRAMTEVGTAPDGTGGRGRRGGQGGPPVERRPQVPATEDSSTPIVATSRV